MFFPKISNFSSISSFDTEFFDHLLHRICNFNHSFDPHGTDTMAVKIFEEAGTCSEIDTLCIPLTAPYIITSSAFSFKLLLTSFGKDLSRVTWL